jgi:hypothetical protein
VVRNAEKIASFRETFRVAHAEAPLGIAIGFQAVADDPP